VVPVVVDKLEVLLKVQQVQVVLVVLVVQLEVVPHTVE
tara:strand:- start:105 stop:218 length:114 start_codon:yes stop_codon:yes gene_type:complete